MSSFYIKGLNSCVMRNQNIEKYRVYLTNAGYTEAVSEADASNILIWTCSFRGDVDENSFSQITNLQTEYPNKNIFICGCMPDIFPERFSAKPNIIPWKNDELLFQKYFPYIADHPDHTIDLSLRSYETVYSELPDGRKGSTFLDSFSKILIAEGCNMQCTYCTERLAMPPYRSFPMQDLVSEVKRKIAESGNHTIALMADSPGEYGCETGESIITLIHALCGLDDAVKIVLHNMNPIFFLKHYEGFKSLILAEKIHHLNLPVQSANDRVLKLMKREYTKSDLDYLFDSLKTWGLKKYDTHVIAGFPSETAEEFDETIGFLCEKKPAYVLASPCLVSPSALISQMPNKVSEQEKIERLEKIDTVLSNAGIIVNTPYNSLSQRRIKEINGRKRQ